MKPNLIVRTVDHFEVRVEPEGFNSYSRLIAWCPRNQASCQVFRMTEQTLRDMAAMLTAAADDMGKINKIAHAKAVKAEKKAQKQMRRLYADTIPGEKKASGPKRS